jgi:hypothetical protein
LTIAIHGLVGGEIASRAEPALALTIPVSQPNWTTGS